MAREDAAAGEDDERESGGAESMGEEGSEMTMEAAAAACAASSDSAANVSRACRDRALSVAFVLMVGFFLLASEAVDLAVDDLVRACLG